MKLSHYICVSVLFLLVLFAPLCTDAGEFVTGPEALKKFNATKEKYLDTYVDFESIETGLYTKLPGLPIKLWTDEIRWPPPNKPAPSNTPVAIYKHTPDNHRLMGVTAAKVRDGQSSYVIYFDECLQRVGLFRPWAKDYSITRFFSETKLLVEHHNNIDHEFIGYIGDGSSDCVKFLEIDGDPSDPDDINNDNNKLYQVGSVDNLFFSTPSIEPIIKFDEFSDSIDVPVLTAGDKLTITIKTQNIASYTIPKIDIVIIIYAPGNQIIYNKLIGSNMDIPPGETVITKIPGKVDVNPEMGVYKVEVEIFSAANVLVSKSSKSYRITDSKGATVSPIFQLLLNPGDSD